MSLPTPKRSDENASRGSSVLLPEAASAKEKGLYWFLGVFLALVVTVITALGQYWSIEPTPFDVVEAAMKKGGFTDKSQLPVGYTYTATVIGIAETLMYKRGGYLSNDVTLPSLLLDNMPNWEFGCLVALRDSVTALRNHFARAQSQSKEDPDLAAGEPQLYYDHMSWGLPSSESEYQKGIESLYRYLERVGRGGSDAMFHARADNLRQFLEVLDKRLGSLSLRLSASTDVHEFTLEQQGVTTLPKTPWLQVDDIFYEARGYTWALLHVLRAAEVDFKETFEGKNAYSTFLQIVHELEYAQTPTLSPVVLNGSGFGLFSNYSVTLANYVARAGAAILDLRDVLLRG